jgi:hypothetical protein
LSADRVVFIELRYTDFITVLWLRLERKIGERRKQEAEDEVSGHFMCQS